MSAEISPQHNLSLVFSSSQKELDDELKIELIEELAKLMFLLWKVGNQSEKMENSTNER